MSSKRHFQQALYLTLVALLLSGCNRASAEPTATPGPPTTTPTPTTGTITGMVLDADGKPLLDYERETGFVALFCPSDDSDVECLREDYGDMDMSVLISSICDADDTADSCLLHLGQSVAHIEPDGSYTIAAVPPGQYDLVVILISGEWAVTIQLVNVEPILAGEVTKRNFVTE